MSRKIGILGAGNVGSTVAAFLALHNLANKIILVDSKFKKVEAEALDIIEMLPYAAAHVNIAASDDVSLLADADILINCVAPETPMSKDDELLEVANIVKTVFPKIMESGFNGIIINVSNPNDAITMLIQEITGLPTRKVFGTGTALDTARLYTHISLTLQLDPTDIVGYVLGEHGNQQFIAWSTVQVGPYSIEHALTQMPEGLGFQYAAVEEIVRTASEKITAGKGYTNFAIAQTVINIVNAILSNKKPILPLSVYSKNYETYLSVPAILCKEGIRFNTTIILNDDELAKLELAANTVKETYNKIK